MHKERNKKDVLTEKDFYRVSRVASRVVAMVSCAVRCGSFDILDRKRNLVEYPSFPRDSRTVRRTAYVRMVSEAGWRLRSYRYR
jgi:hypothetical protein